MGGMRAEMVQRPQGLNMPKNYENLCDTTPKPAAVAACNPEGTRGGECMERRGETAHRFSSNVFTDATGLLSGPKFFFPDGDDPDECRERPPDANSPRQDAIPDSGESVALDRHEIRCGSWNLAGACAKKVKTLLSQMPECDVLAVQEYPKQPTGWRMIKGDVFHGALFQNHLMYRAVGLFYDATKFHLCRKQSNQRGAWFLLQRKITQKFMWFGALHLPNNEPKEELHRLIHVGFDRGCRKGYPAILMGDFNIHFNWSENVGGILPGVLGSKWMELRRRAAEEGFHQLHPQVAQLGAPTFHSRKGNVANTQIDGAFSTFAGTSDLKIIEQSRNEISTDHDRVEVMVAFRGKRVARVRAGGPRTVSRSPPVLTTITQRSLEEVARTCAKPASLGPKFMASAAVKTLGEMARHSKQAHDWKQYLTALRKEKHTWKGASQQ